MLFERVFGLHVGVAVLTLVGFMVGMCLYVTFELGFRGKSLVMCTFARRPEAAKAIVGVFVKPINVIFVDVGVKGSGG